MVATIQRFNITPILHIRVAVDMWPVEYTYYSITHGKSEDTMKVTTKGAGDDSPAY